MLIYRLYSLCLNILNDKFQLKVVFHVENVILVLQNYNLVCLYVHLFRICDAKGERMVRLVTELFTSSPAGQFLPAFLLGRILKYFLKKFSSNFFCLIQITFGQTHFVLNYSYYFILDQFWPFFTFKKLKWGSIHLFFKDF